MAASDASPPVSASLEEEPSETTEGRDMCLEPLDLSQVRDAAYGPIYFEGKRPVALFIGVLFIAHRCACGADPVGQLAA